MMCVLCVLIGLTYANFRQLEKANRLNIHTYHVLEKVVMLRAALNEGELRLRGFALTADPRFLSEAGHAANQTQAALEELQRLTVDRDEQQQRLQIFATDYQTWRSKFALISPGSFGAAERIDSETEARRAGIDRMESEIDVIENTERELLRERAWQQQTSQRRAATFLLYASICTITFMAAFVVLLGFQINSAHESNRRLVASQEQLQAVLETAPIILYSIDLDEKFTLMTGRGATSVGLSAETAVGRTMAEVIQTPYDFEPVRAALQGRPNISTSVIKGMAFETNRLPLRDNHGKITGMIGVGLDVTERVQAEDALRKSEARFRSVIDSLQEVVFQIDGDGRWSFLNPAWRLLLGHDVESSLGKSALEFAYPEDRDTVFRLVGSPSGQRKQVRRELLRILTRSGDSRWMDVQIQVERDEEGQFLGASGTLSDVNDRKLAQEELLATTTMQKAILNSANYSIIAVSAEGTIESFNKAARELLGYSATEVRGRQSVLIFHDELEVEARAHELSEELGQTILPGFEVLTCKARDGATDEREWTYLSRSGKRVPMRLSITELRGMEGELSGFLFIGYDLTESRRAESIKNEFVSVVSHELRTPLTSIRGALGLLAGGVAGKLPESASQMIEIARKNSDRLVLLINDILDIEKIESGKMRFETRPLVVSELLSNAYEQNLGYGETLNVGLVLDTEGVAQGQQVEGDEDRLQQVLSNLISNGCKFTPAGGSVCIGAAVHGDTIRISVTDGGTGVPPEFVPRLFEKFAQADSSSTRKQGGTGLGLAIARAIVEKHGGTIQYIAPQNGAGGACFAFDLPLVQSGIKAPTALATPTTTGKRVLVCEDEVEAAQLLSLFVTKSGYEADIAYNLAQARSMLRNGNYIGMTLDLMLPDGDGADFLAEIRSDPAMREFPVIVVSVQSRQGVLRGDAIDVLDWLRKPVDAKRLLSSLEQFRSSGKPRILHVEDDEDVRQVMAAILGQTAQITPAATLSEARTRLSEAQAAGEPFNLAILDVGLPDGSGLELLSFFSATDPPIPIILFSASELAEGEASMVAASLVKSRTTNEVLRDTIQRLLNGHS
jgi:PAS domain S-box-containing protein